MKAIYTLGRGGEQGGTGRGSHAKQEEETALLSGISLGYTGASSSNPGPRAPVAHGGRERSTAQIREL